MTTTNARRASTGAAPTVLIPAGQLVQQAREEGSAGLLSHLARAQAGLDQEVRRVGIVGSPDQVIAELADHFATIMETTGELPAEFSGSVAASIEAHKTRTAEARVIDMIRRHLQDRTREVQAESAADALRWLDGQLQSLLTHVRASTGDLGPAADQYREIRRAQEVLVAEVRGHVGLTQALHFGGITRIPMDEQYAEAVGEVDSWLQMGAAEGRVYQPEPWPGAIINPGQYELLPSTDPRAFLVWLAARRDAWVPTVDELSDALDARRVAIAMRTPMRDLRASEDVRVEGLRHLGRLDTVAAR